MMDEDTGRAAARREQQQAHRTLLAIDASSSASCWRWAAEQLDCRVKVSRSVGGARHVLAREAVDLVAIAEPAGGLTGAAAVRAVRAATDAPVFVATRDRRAAERAQILLAGADDVVSLPADVEELLARARALLRRDALERSAALGTIHAKGVEIDLERHEARREGVAVPLTPVEVRILGLLCGNPGKPFTRREILEHLWESPHIHNERVCDVYVSKLRRKVEREPSRPETIVTAPGIGYYYPAGGDRGSREERSPRAS